MVCRQVVDAQYGPLLQATASKAPSALAGNQSNLADSRTQEMQAFAARAGKLHFVKFETARIDECIDFIEAKGLHRVSGAAASGGDAPDGKVRVVATGGGAYKYADIFQVRTACRWRFVSEIPKHLEVLRNVLCTSRIVRSERVMASDNAVFATKQVLQRYDSHPCTLSMPLTAIRY